MNLDQTDVINIPDLIGKPVEEPTDSCKYRHALICSFLISVVYHLYHCQFQRLAGRIWDQCFCVTQPTYRVVIDLEDQLRKFELDLPSSLRYQTTQMAVARPYLALQVCITSSP
jgi:hypothetical protein